MRAIFLGITAAAVVVTLQAQPHAAELSGRARVVDGDTLAIGNARIRLFGIDAPESKQTCTLRGKPWACGQEAKRALADEIGDESVECRQTDIDRYKRVVAVCMVNGIDLNEFMVRTGWALAYRSFSKAYVPAEAEARRTKVGIWQSKFEKPWDWRRRST